MKQMRRFFLVAAMSAFWLGTFAGNTNALKGETTGSATHYEFIGLRLTPTSQDLADCAAEGVESRMAAFLMQKLRDCTFTREDVVPGESVQRTVAHKQEIYNAVKNIRKGLDRAIDRDPSLAPEARTDFEQVLNVAIAAFYDDNSTAFEQELRQNRRDFRKQMEVFASASMK